MRNLDQVKAEITQRILLMLKYLYYDTDALHVGSNNLMSA